MMTDTKNKENDLFEKYKENRPHFISDGLVEESSYWAAQRRIIFVLKESYDNTTVDKTWDLREKILGIKGHTLKTVVRWAYGLTNFADWRDVEQKINDPAGWDEILKSIGVMNIKKSPSWTSITNAGRLYHESEKDEFLQQQWSLYRPDITVCGGHEPFRKMVFALGGTADQYKKTSKGEEYWENKEKKIFLHSCHPAARRPAKGKYQTVLEAVKEIILAKKS